MLAKHFREINKAQTSLTFLKVLIYQSEDVELFFPYIEKIRCLLQIDCFDEIQHAVKNLCYLLNITEEIRSAGMHSDLDFELCLLIGEFREKDEFLIVVELVRCMFKLLLCYQGQQLINKIISVFCLVKTLPNEIIVRTEFIDKIVTEKQKFAEKFELLSELLKTAQKATFAFPTVTKTILTASLLYRTGEELDKVYDYVNSSLIYAQAIAVLEVGGFFGTTIEGESLSKLGSALKNMKKLPEAKSKFEKALQLYQTYLPYEITSINSIQKNINEINEVQSKLNKNVSVEKKQKKDSKFQTIAKPILAGVFCICAIMLAVNNKF